MLQPAPRKKHGTGRWIRRGILLLVVIYAAMALVPCAVPPQQTAAQKADTSWMEAEASDLNADRALLLPTGEEALATRLALIQNAQTSIDLGSYIYAADESGYKISAALLAAAERGVKVRLITDGLIGWINLGNDPLGPALGSHPNIEIKFYNPVDVLRPQGLNARYHEKFFLVDDTWLLMGGRNVSDEFLTGEDDPHYNYDQDVLMYRLSYEKRDAVAQMGDYFTRMWFSDLCALRYDDADAVNKAEVQTCREKLVAIWQELSAAYDMRLPDPEQDMVAVEKTLLLVNDTAPNPTAPILWNRMCQLMSTAQKRLWMVTPYLVMDSAMRDDLTAVCASAPEDVKVLVNSRETGNNIIASADYTIHRPMAERLGIPLWEFCGGWSMHTKSVLIDDNLSLIGSSNFDPRSAYLDTELMLAVYSEGLNAQLAANMDSLWSQSVQYQSGAYLADAPVASFWKMAAITLLSPFVSLLRYLV